MTTAGRATFHAARGGNGKNERHLGALSTSYSSKDLASHTKLKFRQDGQGSVNDLKGRNFREEERSIKDKKGYSSHSKLLAIENKPHSSSSSSSRSKHKSDPDPPKKKARTEQEKFANLDSDMPNLIDSEEEDEDDDDDDDFGDDDLELELRKIKEEREAERKKKEMEKKENQEREMMENILNGNPLMNMSGPSEFKVKRSWDDDAVFKNCARVQNKSKKPSYINDLGRSEFHKKFMDKYIK